MTEVETSMARTAVRPFRINVPEEELVDLRRRILATRWPDKETVADRSQGVPLATMQELARYYDRIRLAHVRGETRRFWGSYLLGKQVQLFQRQEPLRPDGRERLSWRAVSSPAELDRAGLSQTHL